LPCELVAHIPAQFRTEVYAEIQHEFAGMIRILHYVADLTEIAHPIFLSVAKVFLAALTH
jgi:hypothetical protein